MFNCEERQKIAPKIDERGRPRQEMGRKKAQKIGAEPLLSTPMRLFRPALARNGATLDVPFALLSLVSGFFSSLAFVNQTHS